jgi:hypothetical protein
MNEVAINDKIQMAIDLQRTLIDLRILNPESETILVDVVCTVGRHTHWLSPFESMLVNYGAKFFMGQELST